ncbi:unnamed protein product [Cochlearia groenlandica]
MESERLITTETVARTEKKMDMSLDAIIKMSKSNTANVNKGKKQRVSNKTEGFNGNAKSSSVKAQRYMDSRSDVRQGAFAKRRFNNFHGNQFPVTTTIARKAASANTLRGRPFNAGRMSHTNISRFVTAPVQNRSAHGGFVAKQQQREKIVQKQANGGGGGQRQWPQTLDSRFATMKEERMRMQRYEENRSYVDNNGFRQQRQQNPVAIPWTRRSTRFPN